VKESRFKSNIKTWKTFRGLRLSFRLNVYR
jgi:hypothetical protein